MKKHTLGMVFLLVIALGLIGAVSASDNVTIGDETPILDSQYISEGETVSECDLAEEISVDCEELEMVSQSDGSSQGSLSACQDEDVEPCEDDSY